MINNLTAGKYYLAIRPSQTNGLHPIHREGCPFMPHDNKRIYLGNFLSVADASLESMKYCEASCECRFCQDENFKNEGNIESRKRIFPARGQLSAVRSGAIMFLMN
jgi:hypothetical protein